MRVVRVMLAIEVNPEALPEKNGGAVQVALFCHCRMAFVIHSDCTERYLKDNVEWFFN